MKKPPADTRRRRLEGKGLKTGRIRMWDPAGVPYLQKTPATIALISANDAQIAAILRVEAIFNLVTRPIQHPPV